MQLRECRRLISQDSPFALSLLAPELSLIPGGLFHPVPNAVYTSFGCCAEIYFEGKRKKAEKELEKKESNSFEKMFGRKLSSFVSFFLFFF